ncbi:LysE family translocator [Aquisalimonas asiatica]|uniref:Threonine/homoserine/homoserine lactone efflux protein n=1 Tax=Aquisalimonas asiatica TaxID=406100 RepID=A0A1H8TE46_9GAMM|nr:LysE family translocator [Aquisalimonas asiatica]SEO89380.1 Threonine/homoserine/homoserine lactone efflux protein [Aquisalimonas asiatica]
MSLASTVALFAAMAALAALPSLSVLLVTTRAASSGFPHGVAVAVGVVLGDLVFVALAVFGLVVVAELMGAWFPWVKLAAGVYLIWLGTQLWRQAPAGSGRPEARAGSLFGSATAGLLLTLSDQKAVVFYFAFFPAFVEPASLSWPDVALIVGVTVFAVGGVKTLYAWAAARSGALVSSAWDVVLSRGAGVMLILAGATVLASVARP